MSVQRPLKYVMAVLGVAALCSGLVVVDGVATASPSLVSFTRADYPLANEPYETAIASADVNGDHVPDLVAQRTVRLGNGDGTFAAPHDFVASTPQSVAVGSLNEDSIVDLVTAQLAQPANGNQDAVFVQLGNGDGTFRDPYKLSVSAPMQVALGDLNGDSILDLIVADNANSSIVTFLGLGDGTFTDRHDTDAPSFYLALADLNGDAKLDIADAVGQSVLVLLGNGDGTFPSRAVYPTSGSTLRIAVGDLNNDGALDLVVSTAADGTEGAAVLRGTGDGTFGWPTQIPIPVATLPFGLALADVNGDSILDVAIGNYYSWASELVLGVGDGTFTSPAALSTGEQVRDVIAADFNGDGREDLALTSRPPAVSVLLNAGAPSVPGPPIIGAATASDGTGATVSWSAPTSDGGSPITGYVITPYIGAVAQTPVTLDYPGTSATIATATGVTYTFTVAASNAAGTGPQSAHSNEVTPSMVPDAPTIGAAAARDRSATVSWQAPAYDGGSPITGYVVTVYVGYGPVKTRIFNSPLTTQTVTGLTDGTTYRFRVFAYNAIGTGPYSKASNPVTPAPTAPDAPTIGTAVAGDGHATVSWTAPAADGGSPITGYVVTAYIGYWALPAVTFNSTVTTEVVTGLTNGTTYRFRVQAVNAIGTSGYSKVTNPVTASA